MKNVFIFCDGGSRGNPGDAASAFAVEEGGKTVFSGAKYLGKATNNVAEYRAVLMAVDWLLINQKNISGDVHFVLDSELVVRQIKGLYKVKNEVLKELYREIKEKLSEIKLEINFESVKREKNKLADFLVNEKLDSVL